MRNFLFCLAVVLLSSCIPVEDFGICWKKGTVDPALLGTWVEITSPARDADDRKEARRVTVPDKKNGMQVINKGGIYQIDSLDEQERRKNNYVPVSARTLTVGRYTFLMVVDREVDKKGRVTIVRGLIRYRLDGGTFSEYSLADGPMGAFLKEKYPRAKNIEKPGCKDKESKCLFGYVRIRTLDDEVFKVLSEIPDKKQFWTDAGRFRRQSRPAG